MNKKVVAGLLAFLVVSGCLYFRVVTFISSFPAVYVEICKDVFGETVRPLRSFKAGTTSVPIEDYASYQKLLKGDSTVSWEFIDANHRQLTIVLSCANGKYNADVKYGTLTETEDAIARIVKTMFGPDTIYEVAPEVVNGYVSVTVQGNEYRWKDGTLERVR